MAFYRYLSWLIVGLLAFVLTACSQETAEPTQTSAVETTLEVVAEPEPRVNPSETLVLVSGITGNQGSGVGRVLLEKGYQVRGLSRDITSEKSQAWSDQGVEMVQGDWGDHDSITAAVQGIDYFFLNIPEWTSRDFVGNAKHAIDQAITAGTKHIIFTSTVTSNPDETYAEDMGKEGQPSKRDIEEYLRASGHPYSTLRVYSLMENFLGQGGTSFLTEGIIDYGSTEDVTYWISGEDIGQITDGIIQNPDVWTGREVDLASDATSGFELAALLTQVTGHEVAYNNPSWEEYDGMPFMKDISIWLDQNPQPGDLEQLRAEFPEMDTLEGYLLAHGFDNLDTEAAAEGPAEEH